MNELGLMIKEWETEAKKLGSNFQIFNWRTEILKDNFQREIELYKGGISNRDILKSKFEAYASACRQKHVRVDGELVLTVTPQVQPSTEELKRMCTLFGVNLNEYIQAFL
jgi:hypothetical protein